MWIRLVFVVLCLSLAGCTNPEGDGQADSASGLNGSEHTLDSSQSEAIPIDVTLGVGHKALVTLPSQSDPLFRFATEGNISAVDLEMTWTPTLGAPSILSLSLGFEWQGPLNVGNQQFDVPTVSRSTFHYESGATPVIMNQSSLDFSVGPDFPNDFLGYAIWVDHDRDATVPLGLQQEVNIAGTITMLKPGPE